MVIEKTNFLNEIFLDYQKDKSRDNYCLYRWCTTCGNRKIRDELFLRSIEELEIDFEETKMEKGFLSLSNIRDGEIHKKIVELICQKLNDLSEQEIDTMLGLEPFRIIWAKKIRHNRKIKVNHKYISIKHRGQSKFNQILIININ